MDFGCHFSRYITSASFSQKIVCFQNEACMLLDRQHLLVFSSFWLQHRGICITFVLCWTTGALHASHLGDCRPLAYSSTVLYIKMRQVWKSQSETDWPHLGIMPDFSTEKNHGVTISPFNIHMLTRDSSDFKHHWTNYCIPQKQKICRFKRIFTAFKNSRCSIVCLPTANPMTRRDCSVLFLHTC